MKFRLFLFIFNFFIFGFSQELPTSSVVDVIDEVTVNSAKSSADSLLEANPASNNIVDDKKFKAQFQSKYKGEDYNYSTVEPKESLWKKLQKKIIKFLNTLFGNIDPNKSVNYADNILRFFAIVLGGLILYFLIKVFLNKNGNFFFSKKNKKLNIHNQNLQENIHEINFPESIANFERQKDYRSAIRYQFLLVLKKLSGQKYINWNPEKTNKDYLSEIINPNLKEKFKKLIYIFDYVWYGEFSIDEEKYQELKKKFSDFKI